MKKIFGILSLIAIFMVAFTSQAFAEDDIGDKVTLVLEKDNPSIEVVVMERPTFYVAVANTVSSKGVGGLDADVNSDSGALTNDNIENNLFGYNYGLNSRHLEILMSGVATENVNGIDNFKTNYNCLSPLLVKDIATNVGKLRSDI